MFSFASGIFHPYYVSFLAPFAAALVGAGVGADASPLAGRCRRDDRAVRVIAPLAIAAGAVTELVVLGELNGSLAWAKPLIIAVAGACAVILALKLSPKLRAVLLAVALAALLAAPAAWAAQTLGHATSGTFPAGGPASASIGGPGGGGPGGGFGRGAGGRGGFTSPGGGGVAGLFSRMVSARRAGVFWPGDQLVPSPSVGPEALAATAHR